MNLGDMKIYKTSTVTVGVLDGIETEDLVISMHGKKFFEESLEQYNSEHGTNFTTIKGKVGVRSATGFIWVDKEELKEIGA